MEVVAAKDRRDMKPLILKLSVALAVSVAGFLLSQVRPRARGRQLDERGNASESGEKSNGGGLKDELRLMRNEEALGRIINGTTTTTTTTTTKTTTLMGLSPTSKCSGSGDEEGFLLPEFNDIVVKGLEATGRDAEIAATPKKPDSGNGAAAEQEISRLKSLVGVLRERERGLELQLLEYYGMQEQEANVRELESRLKINNVEAKFYNLKIEALEADNRRLQAQLSDYSRVVGELESARAKAKMLKRKLKTEGENAREKMATLHQKLSLMQDMERKESMDRVETERKLKRLREFEEEAQHLRKANSRLLIENSELSRKLESAQKHELSSSLEKPQLEVFENTRKVREKNEELMMDIDQLKTDRCSDIEQLVYLKWVNACLRYELRNYKPPPGKPTARDLSKNLSPKSREKAKQLVLKYANSGGHEKGNTDFDSECSSSSQASSADQSADNSPGFASPTKYRSMNKHKFLGKLKKLMLGKDHQGNKISAVDRSAASSKRIVSVSTCLDDATWRDSYDSLTSCVTEEHASVNEPIEEQRVGNWHNKASRPRMSSIPSLDIRRLRRHHSMEVGHKIVPCKGDVERSYASKISNDDKATAVNSASESVENKQNDTPEKLELKKYAEALQGVHRSSKVIKKRSSSFCN